jgi:hypothetical protein
VKIRVFKAFNLLTNKGMKRFTPGVHDVPEDEATHWYTKLHAELDQEGQEPPKKKKSK